ncbi:MAG: carbamoyl-phosphate synthase (glutamine-hydrolyzing) large subunit [Candidatus Micrarchaeia archaeon]
MDRLETKKRIKKVLVLGSGPIKIGEAAEFDYSGSQALIALREEGIESILVNSNVATVQTSHDIADKVYLLPVQYKFVERVIKKERPDGIMIGFGGQTALNAGIDLYRKGILRRYKVKVLGTSIGGIEDALSRERFRETMRKAQVPVPESGSAKSKEEAVEAALKLGFPLMLRVSFNLGGRGSAIIRDMEGLNKEVSRAFSQSKIGEILLERYLEGWLEIEYEVVRDMYGNIAVTACIENLDPMGVHTGESTVITPAQTLDNEEYQEMRSMAIKVAESIDLVGECNVQFALDPKSRKYFVIETNPRMSRSSALASKATGYPLAYVGAKLALGYKLYEIANSISGATSANFEPSLDYVTIKIPRWDIEKFDMAEDKLSTEMKSIGEVMAIGRTFEEALQKAIRMLDIGEPGLFGSIYGSSISKTEALSRLKDKKPYWFLYAAKAFKEGATVDEVYNACFVGKFFLNKMLELTKLYEQYCRASNSYKEKIYPAMKARGFLDEQLGISKAMPFVKQIDTLAGEWPAKANYLYTTYAASEDDIKKTAGRKLLVVGAGVFRIGVSVEFDWGSTSLAKHAKKYYDEVAMINYNPETVSTDWSNVDKLYFDELTPESVEKIYRKFDYDNIALFTAGQVGNNLAYELEKKKIKILGTSGESIDFAEERSKFSKLLDRLGIKEPDWISANSEKEIKKFIEESGFPVIVRPSYVLSGSAMKIARNWKELGGYIKHAVKFSKLHPVVISKFISDGFESELDCASDSKNVAGISLAHVEEAGVHSGDATIYTPIKNKKVESKMKETALVLANELEIKGPFNLQFVSNSDTYVIELNLRASRSMPFSSKSVGINLMEESLKGIFGKLEHNGFYEPKHNAFAVKTSQFSWGQLRGSYPFLGPEMHSTGETAALGYTFEEALLKSWLGVVPNKLPDKNILIYGLSNMSYLKKASKVLNKKYNIYTIEGAEIYGEQLSKEKVKMMMKNSELSLLITDNNLIDIDYEIRRLAADINIPMILNGRLAIMLAKAFGSKLSVGEIGEYW